jgi:signal transduction histidine kinase
VGLAASYESGDWEPAPAIRALAEALDEGVALCRAERIVWASSRLAALLALGDAGELVGRSLDEWLLDLGAGLPAAGGTPVECGVRRLEPGSRRLRVRCGAPLPPDGSLVPWLVLDVTREARRASELLRMSQDLHAANRELEDLRERVGREASEREELVQMVSHELRTPVTVISGYNKLLLSGRSGALTDEQQRFLRESSRSCQRLDAFIENLLDACSEGVEVGLEARVHSLDPVITGVVAYLMPILEEQALEIDLHLDPAARHARFEPSRIEQVLTNLLSNSIKYGKSEKAIRVETALIAAAGHRFVEVSVVDGGPGVARADRERIFEPYARAGGEGAADGLGLGLAICRRIVEAHGGRISVRDVPGGGSRFAFTLPAASGAERG